MFEHHRDEVVDPLGGGLGTEVKGLIGGEGLAEDHHCVDMCVNHCLDAKSKNVLLRHSMANTIQCTLDHLN